MARIAIPIMERFERHYMPEPNSGCWLWTAGVNGNGYGRFYDDNYRQWPAHRWLYVFLNGPVPDHYDIDHLCRTPACVNPDHLEAVTRQENLRRGIGPEVTRKRHAARRGTTQLPLAPVGPKRANQNDGKRFCKRGHEFTPENTYVFPSGGRMCRICHRLRSQQFRERNRRTADV